MKARLKQAFSKSVPRFHLHYCGVGSVNSSVRRKQGIRFPNVFLPHLPFLDKTVSDDSEEKARAVLIQNIWKREGVVETANKE